MSASLRILRDKRGDFVRLLGLPRGADGMCNASALDWARADFVLEGLNLEHVLVRRKRMEPNLVSCTLTKCFFEGVSSDNSFWAANSTWRECVFDECKLRGTISPGNRFSHCRFNHVLLEGYRPYDTVFEQSTFSDCTFIGTKAQYLTREAVNRDPELQILSTSVLFKNCVFARTKFRGCHFANIRFEECEFSDPIVEHCDFTGCTANPKWWRDDQQGHPSGLLPENWSR